MECWKRSDSAAGLVKENLVRSDMDGYFVRTDLARQVSGVFGEVEFCWDDGGLSEVGLG